MRSILNKIAVVTGTRAEYGLLKPLLEKIKEDNLLNLQLIVTGMHLSPEFGETVDEIIQDDFEITENVELLLSSDTDVGVGKAMGLGLISFSEIFRRIQPDLLILLGDRFEIFSAASAASVLKIPIAHIHGGETTEGAFDEAFRHSITKMSQIHFVATNDYRKRVIQLGESPKSVYNVGALGVENIIHNDYIPKENIFNELGLNIKDQFFLITFHPTTLEKEKPTTQIRALLNVLLKYKKFKIVIAKANSDTNGRMINKIIDEFIINYPKRFITFYSLGTKKYLSLMKHSTIVIGNSSSGIIEAPSLKVPTLNIGDRQKGRVRSESIFDCNPNEEDISYTVDKILSYLREDKIQFENRYGIGDTSTKVLEIIKEQLEKTIDLKKKFYDIEVPNE